MVSISNDYLASSTDYVYNVLYNSSFRSAISSPPSIFSSNTLSSQHTDNGSFSYIVFFIHSSSILTTFTSSIYSYYYWSSY